MDIRSIISAVFLLQASVSIHAQDYNHSRTDTLSLNAVVVSSPKAGGNVAENPACIDISTSLEAKAGSSLTVADILKGKPGISKGGDGIWATNINLRGLGENRLVTLIDNNRVETATDLTTSLSMIDVNDIDHIEVIRGAQSSVYGSGAIGGVINIITKDGHFSESPYLGGCVTTSYTSVNNGIGEYISLNGGGKRWYVKANGSYSAAQDARTPEGYLANSGYKSSDAALTAAYKPADGRILKGHFQRNHSWDVGIPGGAAFSAAATASYRNADRTLASLSYDLSDLSQNLDLLHFKIWYQGILYNVEMQPNVPLPQTGAVPTLVTPSASHRTFGANAESTWSFDGWNHLTLGAEAWQRRISSSREKYISQYASGVLAAEMIRGEIPLPEASFTSAGLFAQDEMRFMEDRLILSLGGRADINVVRNGECHNVEYVKDVASGTINQNPPGKFVTFSAGGRTDPSMSANAGLLYKADRKCDLVMNVSRAYRSPALEELFKFIDLTGNKIHFGNPALKAEKSLGGDIGVRFHGEKLNFRASAYANRIRDMIVERKTNRGVSSVNDTLVLCNASRAVLTGLDAEISYEIISGLTMYASAGMTTGRETSAERGWLPNIPPLEARAGITYENRDLFGADFSATFAGEKKSTRIAAGERPTEAWYRLDFAIHSKIFSLGRCCLQFFGGMDNITDASYTNFLSTNRGNITCEPGRNFFIRANLSF